MSPLRSCIACRRKTLSGGLLRLVAVSDGSVQLDRRRVHPGRGAWLCAEANCVRRLCRRPKGLERALRVRVDIRQLEERIHLACLEAVHHALLAASRGGCVVSGQQRLRERLPQGGLAVLVFAADASPRARRLSSLAVTELRTHELELDARALGRAVGKGPRAVLGVRPGSPSRPLFHELRRYADLGYPPPRCRAGDRSETTRRPGTTGPRGCGQATPSSSASSHSKRGQPQAGRHRKGSACPRKRS